MKDYIQRKVAEFKEIQKESFMTATAKPLLLQPEAVAWYEQVLIETIAQAIAEERERVRGMKPCRFGCYCKLCGLCDAETMIHCGDCVMNKPISLLASLDKPLT